jgi:ATP-dependent DNA helicase RecG
MADRVLDLIYTKYFRAYIRYEGIQRVEDFPVPQAAMREAVLNAIVHRDYSTGVSIQIKILPTEVIIYNDGGLPESWTIDDLLGQHRSQPRNSAIANTFFRSGQIETWGRGIEKIEEACRAEGKPLPVFRAKSREVSVSFPFTATAGDSVPPGTGHGDASAQVPKPGAYVPMSGAHVPMYTKVILAAAAQGPVHRTDLIAATGLSQSSNNYRRYVLPLVEAGLLALTLPDKPRSPSQHYVLTDSGRRMLESLSSA